MKNKRALTVAGLLMVVLMLTVFTLVGCNKKTPGTSSTTAVTTEAAVTSEGTTVTTVPGPVFEVAESDITTYNNPLATDGGDPFCMRYDGKYYLYCSNSNNEPIHVRVSEDLATWSEQKICAYAADLPGGMNEHGDMTTTLPAYAPEVTYFNGKFYMVTSFGGMGHYALVADDPLGPFKVVTENWGRKIDGHIFIDNDGKWYFYSANSENAVGNLWFEMTSPTTVVGNGKGTGAAINDGGGAWTEGPMVVYHDGVYFLTYTGNHVGSSSYRIDYATSKTGPTTFRAAAENPVIVASIPRVGNISTDMHGTGHSSTVKGPDLDAYYIVYHAKIPSAPGRTMCADRIVFNGTKMTVLGPTGTLAQTSNLPEIYAQLDSASDADIFDGVFTISGGEMTLGAGAKVISKKGLGRDYYTIEITASEIGKGGKAGAVFGYKDDQNYGSALFDTATEELVITFIVGGVKTEYREKLVRSFDMPYDFSAVQAIQIEKNGNEFTFYVNDRELCKKESSLDGDRVGVIADGANASFGYIGATANVGGSSTKDQYKPSATLSGYIAGIHCLERDVATGTEKRTGEGYVIAPLGQSLNYRVLAEDDGFYDVAVRAEAKEGAVIAVYADGKHVFDLTFEADRDFATEVGRGISLTEGGHVITLYVKEGGADIISLEVPRAEQTVQITDSFDSKSHRRLIYSEGTGLTVSGGVLKGTLPSRRLYGSQLFGDYTMEFDVTVTDKNVSFGAIVRAQNPCVSTLNGSGYTTNPTDGEVSACINWMQGYYLVFGAKRVTLYKASFDSSKKNESDYGFTINANETYKIRIDCEGANIRAYINGELVLDYTDSDPYIRGLAGFRSTSAPVTYDNLVIAPVKAK